MEFANTFFALLPPALAITLAIITRRVLLSLGTGIVLGALMHNGFAIGATLTDLLNRVTGLFYSDGAIDSWNVPLLGFLLTLGMTIAVINMTGAAKAFATWARSRVKSRRDARLMTMALGFIVFIDDYFNTLTVGSVAKPVADDHKVSREELAYGVDSTAAPICVMAPISSWGAYIMGIIGTIFAAHEITEISAFSAFIQMIPMNLYALSAIAVLLCAILFNLQLGSMAGAYQRVTKTGQLWDEYKGTPPGSDQGLPQADNGSVWGLLLPILALVVAAIYFIMASGAANLGETPFTVIGALENTDTTMALFKASLVSFVVATVMALSQKVPAAWLGQAVLSGVKSMMPAVLILLFAWTIAGVIRNLETGNYLASLVQGTLPLWCLPVLIFVLSGVAGFSTGTSWGTFAIMMPIAADIALASEAALLLPMMAAVLAGSVFGDHSSPISDTTVLSGTGAGCHHIDHFTTQLPYAISAAIIATVGYLVIGLTHSVVAGLLACAVALAVWLLVVRTQLQRA